jgi:hypothetical protein
VERELKVSVGSRAPAQSKATAFPAPEQCYTPVHQLQCVAGSNLSKARISRAQPLTEPGRAPQALKRHSSGIATSCAQQILIVQREHHRKGIFLGPYSF